MDWQVEGVPQSIKIPSLSLQPLLENAIYHGIQQMPDGGTVTIKADYQQGVMTLEVSNPVLSNMVASFEGNHLAQENIQHRLQALYGPKAGLTTQIDQQQHVAILTYPVAETVAMAAS